MCMQKPDNSLLIYSIIQKYRMLLFLEALKYIYKYTRQIIKFTKICPTNIIDFDCLLYLLKFSNLKLHKL